MCCDPAISVGLEEATNGAGGPEDTDLTLLSLSTHVCCDPAISVRLEEATNGAGGRKEDTGDLTLLSLSTQHRRFANMVDIIPNKHKAERMSVILLLGVIQILHFFFLPSPRK